MRNPGQGGRDDDPIELVAVRDDDALLDALGAGDRAAVERLTGRDEPLVALLAAWADDSAGRTARPVAADPAADEPAPPASPVRRARYWLAYRAAAAVVAILALSGTAMGAGAAQPGDTLWAFSTVLHAERARSVEAASDIEQRQERARTALREGKLQAAAHELAAGRAQLAAVRPEEGHDLLVAEQRELEVALLGESARPHAGVTTTAPPGDTSAVAAAPPAGPDQAPPPAPAGSTSGPADPAEQTHSAATADGSAGAAPDGASSGPPAPAGPAPAGPAPGGPAPGESEPSKPSKPSKPSDPSDPSEPGTLPEPAEPTAPGTGTGTGGGEPPRVAVPTSAPGSAESTTPTPTPDPPAGGQATSSGSLQETPADAAQQQQPPTSSSPPPPPSLADRPWRMLGV